ncbi:hypothetical protein HGRIS_007907 [Hohenbuehelia grisea]|uniref:DNA polymerase n=1 Tax=Hohenbuehelia grisea TaxID=104357 RepID=A0ABR3J720_9AGAR
MTEPTLRVQINQIDHCMAKAGPLDCKSPHPRVPVIRIFGTSSVGKGACVYIHQVYPYFFVEYKDKLDPPHVKQYIHTLKRSLNSAIALHMKQDPRSTKAKYVRAIILVKGVHFYGFHSSYSPFLKILMANPAHVHRAVSVIQSGTVMQTRFRVYESHLSFILQFMSDFNLYGCGWLELGETWCRETQSDEQDAITQDGHANLAPPSFKKSPYDRLSRMPLELDVVAHQILNRHRILPRNLHHTLEIPGLQRPSEPLILSVRELWDDERKRRQAKGLSPSPDLPVDPTERSRGPGGAWTSEPRCWEEVKSKIEAERGASFETKQPSRKWENLAMSTFESVEALWDKSQRVWRPSVQHQGTGAPEDSFSTAADPPWGEENAERDTEPGEVDIDESFLPVENFDDDEEDLQADDELEKQLEADEIQRLEEGPEENDYDRDFDAVDSIVVEDPEEPNPFIDVPDAGSQAATTDPNPNRDSDASSPHYEAFSSPRNDVLKNPASSFGHPTAPGSSGDSGHTDNLQTPQPLTATGVSCRSHAHFVAAPSVIIHAARTLKASVQPNLSGSRKTNDFQYCHSPPSRQELLNTLESSGLASKIYRDPFYSKEKDAPNRAREYAGLVYRLKGGFGLDTVEPWDDTYTAHSSASRSPSSSLHNSGVGGWEYAGYPPNLARIEDWLTANPHKSQLSRPKEFHSQIEGPTQANIYGIKTSPVTTDVTIRERQHMATLALEVFGMVIIGRYDGFANFTPHKAMSQEEKVPNPEDDEIIAVFYAWQKGDPSVDASSSRRGIIIVDGPQAKQIHSKDVTVDIVSDELELLNTVVDTVVALDPDILTGWEVQRASWGFLIARGIHYGFDIDDLISRASLEHMPGSDMYNFRHTSTLKVAGRHVLNLWRVMRGEMALNVYTFENVAFHVLRKRVPRYPPDTLVAWYTSPALREAAKVLQYFLDRTSMLLEILDVSELVTKTAEFARVFGVDFFSVISRGSQFKVESFMARLAKPESFLMLSPSKADVGKQNAAECMPLIMEPLSGNYNSPLLVLDFQSLYPSLMIAYNYCYSTCLGRVRDFQGQNKFGVTHLNNPPGLLETLKDHIQISPNGMIYVKRHVREGLLGRMQTELLDTRVMIKQAMKSVKDDKALRRILDARQLGLKYILNVTYGYTSATFSGRMPAVEIADSIVQTARETLEKAINVIDSTEKWGARVVYGDTDSLFIYLKGRTKDEAFQIGHDIADAITAMNPAPIKLKFEKVYLPCVLMAKKRYVGFKYENPDDVEPVFDAKGIETVRRDGVPAQQKMTEICLKKLFRSQDLSEIKEYCCRSWTKILEDKVSIQDFVFAKEVKLGTYSDRAPPPPGVAVAARRMLMDPNDEPQYGERIPYVITRGEPGLRLIERAVPPFELLIDSNLHLDADYYITRVLIPPLQRIFNLVGADVRSWYDEMAKPSKAIQTEIMSPSKQDNGVHIDGHMQNSQCLLCGAQAWNGVCGRCIRQPQTTITGLLNLIRKGEQRLTDVNRVCASCTGSAPLDAIECESLDCPWLYERKKAERRGEFLEVLQLLVQELEAGIDFDAANTADNDEYEELRIEYV